MPARNNLEFGNNMRIIRKIRGLTLKEVADKASALSGKVYSGSQIGKWERGDTDISFSQSCDMAKALECSVMSFLFADRGSGATDRLHEEALSLPDDEREIMLYALTEWNGDVHGLIHFMNLYMALPPDIRSNISNAGIYEYEKALKSGHVNSKGVPVDIRLILKKWLKLMEG